MKTVDINCDMGESATAYPYDEGKDLQLLRYISSVNLACGFHAGDPSTMHRLVEASLEQKVAIGAHPGFPDKEQFGRREMNLAPEILYDTIIYQLGALQAFLSIYGSKLRHVKVHGALYNMAARDLLIAELVCNAVKDFDSGLLMYALSGSVLMTTAMKMGLKAASEAFADRTYQEDGSLTPRSSMNALVQDEETALTQALQIAEYGRVQCVSGKTINLEVDTICLHGDGVHALRFARAIHESFGKKGILIRQPG